MKIDDLMIGDWLCWNSEGKKYPYPITAEDFTKGDISDLEPIPLTKEILLKSGFKEFCGGSIIKELSEDEIPTLYVWENNSIYVVDYCSLNKYTYIKDCKYVHEFQHELKSCGIKKHIVL